MASRPDNVTYRRGLADTLQDTAVALHSLSRFSEAEALYREAAKLYEPLLAADTENLGLGRSLEKNHRSLATLCAGTGRLVEALEWMGRGRSVVAGLVQAAPGDAEFTAQLGRADNDRGAVLFLLGRFDEAHAAYGRARDSYEAVLRVSPNVTTYRNSLAMTQYNLAEVLLRAGRPAEARAAAERGRDLSQALIEANPGVYNFQNVLAAQLSLLGEVGRAEGRFGDALAAHEQARAIRESVLKANPDLSLVLPELKDNLIAVGRLERRAGRAVESMAAFAKARGPGKTDREEPGPVIVPSRSGGRVRRGRRTGERERANCRGDVVSRGGAGDARVARRLWVRWRAVPQRPGGMPDRAFRRVPPRRPQRGFTGGLARRRSDRRPAPRPLGRPALRPGARCAARLARAAPDRALAASQVDSAQSTLRRALRAGYRDANRVRHEPDLDLLRAGADFPLLLMDLTFPADPFAERH